MRICLPFCFVLLVAAQYNYGPDVNGDHALEVSNIGNIQQAPAQPALEEYNKMFYSYSAPEHEFEDFNADAQISKAIKTNIRVIFIKGPENTALESAALQLAKTVAVDHTAIYVLSKQSDISSLAAQLQELKSTNTVKPEVHFVKYRTEADAETAQRAIQEQYDNLPGTSINNDQDTASVLNFASKSGSETNVNNTSTNTKTPVVSRTRTRTTVSSKAYQRNSYLPPSRRY